MYYKTSGIISILYRFKLVLFVCNISFITNTKEWIRKLFHFKPMFYLHVFFFLYDCKICIFIQWYPSVSIITVQFPGSMFLFQSVSVVTAQFPGFMFWFSWTILFVFYYLSSLIYCTALKEFVVFIESFQ